MSNFKIYEFHPQVYPRRLWVADCIDKVKRNKVE